MTALRPPEYFPRQPVAALFLAADRVILADTLPFSRQAAHNRARIRSAEGRQWLTVPREHTGARQPLDRLAVVGTDWKRKHVHALRTAYGMASYGEHVLPEIEALLARDYDSLGGLAVATCRWTHRWLGATSELVLASSLPGRPDTLAAIWEAAGASPLLALPESASRDHDRLAVETHVLHYAGTAYRQSFAGFEPGCSSLDVILNHGPRAADLLRARTRLAALGEDLSL